MFPQNGNGGNSGNVNPLFWTGNEGTWYQIFPISFYDSDGDGKGDLPGITQHLWYLSCFLDCPLHLADINAGLDCNRSLHIDGIWLTPIMLGTSYHKYDTEDYMSVDPDFGTIEDLIKLRDECRKRGIKLIVDLAVNHSSAVHPWFLDALEEFMSGIQSQYSSYYNFRTSRERNPNRVEAFGTNGQWWRPDEMPLVIDRLNQRRAANGSRQFQMSEHLTANLFFIMEFSVHGCRILILTIRQYCVNLKK